MKATSHFLGRIAFVVALGLGTIAAKDDTHEFSDWDLGAVVFGEKVSRKDTKGKVVVLEYWGVNCPPCIASLPHLAKMDKKFRDDGLIIIGAESQGSSAEQMEPLLKKAKVEYTIVEGARGPVQVSGIPRVFVFDSEGAMVFDGRPSGGDFEDAVKDALKGAEPAEEEKSASKFKLASNLIEQSSWTNTEGQTIRAAVKKADESTVTFVMTNGKIVDYALEKLSAESQEIIDQALKDAAGEEE